MSTNYDVRFIIARFGGAAKFAAPDSRPGGTLNVNAAAACTAQFQGSDSPFVDPPTGPTVQINKGDNALTLKSPLAPNHFGFELVGPSSPPSAPRSTFYVGVTNAGAQTVGTKIEQDAQGNYQFCPRAIVKRPPGPVQVAVLFELQNVQGPVDLRIQNAKPHKATVDHKDVLVLKAEHPPGSKGTEVIITFDQPLQQTGGGSNGEIILVEP